MHNILEQKLAGSRMAKSQKKSAPTPDLANKIFFDHIGIKACCNSVRVQ